MGKLDLPDFDDMINYAEKIYELSAEKANIDIRIKVMEKEAIEKGFNELLIDGKRPSMSYLESTVKVTGFNNELVELRKKQLELASQIDFYKALLDIYKLKVEVWRTMSANERASVL